MANRVTIVVNADGSAYVEGMEQVNSSTRKMEAETRRLTDMVKNHWVSVMAQIYALKKAWDFAEEAAKADELKQSFINLAASHGVNADELINNLKRVSAETVTTVELMRAAGTAMTLGIPADKLAEMMEIARSSAKITGQTIQKSFEDISIGVARQSRLILDNLGIIIKEEKAYENFARAINKTASQLTEAEKKQAFMNAAMEAGQDIVKRVGDQHMTAAEAMAVFMTKLQEIKLLIGKAIITIASWTSTVLLGISELFAMLLGSVARFLSKLIDLGSKLPWVGEKFKNLSVSLNEFAEFEKGVAEEAKRMANEAYRVGAAVWEEKKAVVGLTQTLKDNKEAVTATIEQKNKLVEAERKLAEAGGKSAIEEQKRRSQLEAKELERAYADKTVTAEEYYTRKRTLENEFFEQQKASIMQQIEAESMASEAKLKNLAGQPQEVLREAELEHATKLIELADQYNQIKSEQDLAELENVYGLLDAQQKLAEERWNAELEIQRLKENSPYDQNLQNYEGDSEIVKDYAKYQMKLQALQHYNTQVIQAMVDAGASQEQIEAAYTELSIQEAKKKRDFQISYAADAAGAISNTLQNLYVATGSKNKTMFEAMKTFAIAETVIKTYLGAAEAYSALAGIPVVGPALATAAAAAAIIAGAARVQAIRSQTMGGSTSISTAGTANPTYLGGSFDAHPAPQRVEENKEAARPVINLYVHGNLVDMSDLAREMAPYIKEAQGDKVDYGF